MKGLFIPDITAEMFRNGCLESIEELMVDGEIYDIEYDPKTKETDNMCYGCHHERHGKCVMDHKRIRW